MTPKGVAVKQMCGSTTPASSDEAKGHPLNLHLPSAEVEPLRQVQQTNLRRLRHFFSSRSLTTRSANLGGKNRCPSGRPPNPSPARSAAFPSRRENVPKSPLRGTFWDISSRRRARFGGPTRSANLGGKNRCPNSRPPNPSTRQIRGFTLTAQPLNENAKQTHHPPTNSNKTTYAASPSAQPLNGSTDQQKTPAPTGSPYAWSALSSPQRRRPSMIPAA